MIPHLEKFAIPFIIFVRRHSKIDPICGSFELRLKNEPAVGKTNASQIFRIAALRPHSASEAATFSTCRAAVNPCT